MTQGDVIRKMNNEQIARLLAIRSQVVKVQN